MTCAKKKATRSAEVGDLVYDIRFKDVMIVTSLGESSVMDSKHEYTPEDVLPTFTAFFTAKGISRIYYQNAFDFNHIKIITKFKDL